jgi:hypothetical protein
MTDPAIRGHSRIWLLDGGASPTVTPLLLAFAAAQSVDKKFGDISRIEVPSQHKRGQYDVVGEIQSGEENVTMDIMLRGMINPSKIFKVANKRCIADFQVHIGKCTDPADYNHGWASGKILAFDIGRLTSYTTDDLGSLESGNEDKINETVTLSARYFYEIGPLTFSERAKSEVQQEIIKILVCDSPACTDCESPSDGCQKVFSISAPAGSSPGNLPEVQISTNGMSTIAHESTITTAAIGEDPSDAACVGDYLVVIFNSGLALHYAALDDLASGVATWTKITTGFVTAKGPICIDGFGPFDTFIGGAGGYIYYTSEPTGGVSVLDAGVATTQNINDIHVYSSDIVIAVGNSNAVIYTVNGNTFSSVTGPAVGVNLNCVYARTEKEWWVGTANGKLYYTKNQGDTWTEKTFSGSGSGSVEEIVFASNHVGYVSHTTSGNSGRILRTVSGGNTWYVLPDGNTALPTNARINSLAICQREVNVLYAAGKISTGDGIVLKGEAAYS